MQPCRFIHAVLAVNLFLLGCAVPAAAQSTAAVQTAQLRMALVGDWVMDEEATADAFALGQFGPKQQVVPNPRKLGQPQTFSTNITNKPFTWQEYATIKSLFLASLRANTNEVSSRMTFAPDGSGVNSDEYKSGKRESVEQFQWVLEGRKLTITNPGGKTPVQTEFTNMNHLSFTTGRGIRLVLKPERPIAPSTNAPTAK